MPDAPCKFPYGHSAAQQVASQEDHISRALRQPPHKVRIPRFAIRHIQPQTISFSSQPLLDIAADAVEHLEFKRVARDPAGCHEALRLGNDFLIMRRYSRIYASFEKNVHQL